VCACCACCACGCDASGKGQSRDVVENVTQQMMIRGLLREEAMDAGAGFQADYVFHAGNGSPRVTAPL
jgi:hypothetical protein